MGPIDSGRRLDKQVMRALLKMGDFPEQKKRDLELYFLDPDTTAKTRRILVLDNDLTIYRTTVDDVVLRKSPTVKEMISIRNAIKILNDKDVVVSKKEETVATIRMALIGSLDLSYDAADLDEIVKEAQASLENAYGAGVSEALILFAELLGFAGAPKKFSINHHEIIGKLDSQPDGQLFLGPVVVYSLAHNQIGLLEKPVGSRDKEGLEKLKQVGNGSHPLAVSGPEVFLRLKTMVLAQKG
jgi:hypothetical protein